MNLINNTSYPALSFEGIDQLKQSFQIVVLRQTYTWDAQGHLSPTEEQDPIKLVDQLKNRNDLMSGILEESDLAHYKPNCDIIIKGHAHAPPYALGKTSFNATIRVQTPNTQTITKIKKTTKYPFVTPNKQITTQALKPNIQYTQGQVLINKTLTVHSPRYAINSDKTITGKLLYKIHTTPFSSSTKKVSLDPTSSFGGYCFLEESSPYIAKLIKLDKTELIAKQQRNLHLNPNHGTIAYMDEDIYNPFGTGYLSANYCQSVKPISIPLSQIHNPKYDISNQLINTMTINALDNKLHPYLVAGFGVRSKSHPLRNQLLGIVNQDFYDNDELLPEEFDFAYWNCAYPDQQTRHLDGNEWITLTNLCSTNTPACKFTAKGDRKLTLYLPDNLIGLTLVSKNHQLPKINLPMKLDTVIISPDTQKVNLVWRAIVINQYQAQAARVNILSKEEKDEIVQTQT